MFVISSTAVFGDASIKRLCQTEQARALVVKGNSVSGIVDPYGKYVGGPLKGDEGIVYADIDMESMIDAKTLHDVVGHYNRFDVLSLVYHRRQPKAIRFEDTSIPGQAHNALEAAIRELILRLERDGKDGAPYAREIAGLREALSRFSYERIAN